MYEGRGWELGAITWPWIANWEAHVLILFSFDILCALGKGTPFPNEEEQRGVILLILHSRRSEW